MRLVGYFAASLILALNGGAPRDQQPLCETRIVHERYGVSGATLEEIMGSIRAHGPIDESGVRRYATTRWNVHWSWNRDAHDNVLPNTVQVRCEVTLVLPSHENVSGLSPSERARWDAFIARLNQHELNHVKHVQAIAPEIQERISSRTKRYGPLSVKAAHRIAEHVLQEVRELDHAYDRSTRHGATEGL